VTGVDIRAARGIHGSERASNRAYGRQTVWFRAAAVFRGRAVAKRALRGIAAVIVMVGFGEDVAA
jgi:hypothetical protein